MKRFAVFAFVFIAAIALLGAQESQTPATFYADAAQQTKEALDASRLLQSKGQWSKAWNLLAALDPENKDGYVLAEKIRLALEGNVANGMLVSFGFVDLAEGQNLDALRTNPPEKQTIADFNPVDLADALEKSGEAVPPVLSYELGNYLYTVNLEYGDNWILESQAVQQKAVENYDRALAYDTYTEKSLSNQAGLLLNLQQYDAVETLLRKAIAAYPENPNFSVSLASALNDQGKFDQVYPIVDEVLANPDTSDATYNAFVEGIKAGLNAGDAQKTDAYVEAMIARFPDEYVPMLIQHLIEVRMGTPEKANAVADDVTAKFTVDTNVVRSLISTWLNAQDPQSGFDYLNRSLEKYTNDDKAAGTLAFYRALMYAQTAQSVDDLKLAMADIEEAEKRFGTVYDKDNQVFQVISQLKDEWNQFLQQQSAPDASAVPSDQSQQPAETPEASSSQTDDQTQQPAETPEASPEASSDATSGATE
ncbi:MAG: hypothetical protein SAMD01599839_10550 [Rectinema sp.]